MRITFRTFSRRAKWIVYPTVGAAMANFLAFILVSLYFGGDALNGYTKAGHFYICAHGACKEVSSAFWRYSYWHALSAFGLIFLVFAEIALFLNTGDIKSAQGD
jgi:hypothetical protein